MSAVTVSVTGAAGQIAYAFLFRLISGEVFGKKRVNLVLLEIPQAVGKPEGLVFELEDCGFATLGDVKCTADVNDAFVGADWIVLLGAFPRGPGMDRSQLLAKNAGIFKSQGEAINKYAKGAKVSEDSGRDGLEGKRTLTPFLCSVKIITVGNPCNTNTAVAREAAPEVDDGNWYAMTTLDVNRAKSLYAKEAGIPVDTIGDEEVVIWGNHSSTMVVDYRSGIGDIANLAAIKQRVQNRGGEIIKARGGSSVASAANAILDTIRNILTVGKFFSAGVVSDGSYGIEKGLIFSFPVRAVEGGRTEIVKGLDVSTIRGDLDKTQEELKGEIKTVRQIFGLGEASKL